MSHWSHAAWSGLAAGLWWLVKLTVAATPQGPVAASPVSVAPGIEGRRVTGAEMMHGSADRRDEQAGVLREIVAVDGLEIGRQEGDHRLELRRPQDGRAHRHHVVAHHSRGRRGWRGRGPAGRRPAGGAGRPGAASAGDGPGARGRPGPGRRPAAGPVLGCRGRGAPGAEVADLPGRHSGGGQQGQRGHHGQDGHAVPGRRLVAGKGRGRAQRIGCWRSGPGQPAGLRVAGGSRQGGPRVRGGAGAGWRPEAARAPWVRLGAGRPGVAQAPRVRLGAGRPGVARGPRVRLRAGRRRCWPDGRPASGSRGPGRRPWAEGPPDMLFTGAGST